MIQFFKLIPFASKIVDKVTSFKEQKQTNEHEIDLEIVSSSWKDEIILVAFLLLFVSPILPGGEMLAERVFVAFGYWPQEFKDLFIFIVYASFGAALGGKGFRGWNNHKARKNKALLRKKEEN